jgi:hypothetical protein
MKHDDDPMVVQCDKCGHFHSNYPEPKHTCIKGMMVAYDDAIHRAAVSGEKRHQKEAYTGMEAVYNKYVEDYNGPGSVNFRFQHIMDDLAERFPDVHNPVMSDGPDQKYIAAIDKLLERADFCEWTDKGETGFQGKWKTPLYHASCGRITIKTTDDGFCSRCGKLIKVVNEGIT